MGFIKDVAEEAVSMGTAGFNSILFGGGGFGDPSKPLKDIKPVGINAGGIGSTLDKKTNTVGIETSPERQAAVQALADTFGIRADQLGALLAQVGPGMGGLTRAIVESLGASRDTALQSLSDSRRRSVGTLRENLSRRRVLGSSFAGDAITRAESEFQRREDQLRAQFGEREAVLRADAFKSEVALSQNLIQEQANARANAIQTTINEMNLQTEVAAALATAAMGQQQQIASLQSQLIAEGNAGIGSLIGAGIGFGIAGLPGAAAGAGIGGQIGGATG